MHISIDNNILPYISICFYQVDGNHIRQFNEICAGDPFNTVTQASRMAVDYLRSIRYNDMLYLYGDASTRNGNTIDDEKRSFLDKFVEGLEGTYHVEEGYHILIRPCPCLVSLSITCLMVVPECVFQ